MSNESCNSTLKLMNSPRLNRIVNHVNQVGSATIEELAEAIGVSMQTIRRDVRLLCEQSLIGRYHGGAARLLDVVAANEAKNIDYNIRQVQQTDEKKEIARELVAQIKDGSSVFLAIGTTMEAIAYELTHKKGLTIFTNSLKVANILHEGSDFDVIIPGGTIQKRNGGLLNSETEAFIRSIRVDYLLFSCGAVDGAGYLLDFYMSEVHIVKMVMERCSKAFLAVDSTKFSTSAPIEIGHIGKIDALFVNQVPSREIRAAAAAADVQIYCSQEN